MKNQNLKFYCLTFLLLAGFALFAHQSSDLSSFSSSESLFMLLPAVISGNSR